MSGPRLAVGMERASLREGARLRRQDDANVGVLSAPPPLKPGRRGYHVVYT